MEILFIYYNKEITNYINKIKIKMKVSNNGSDIKLLKKHF